MTYRDKQTTISSTEQHANIVCVVAGVGIVVALGLLFVWPSWTITCLLDFFAMLYCTAMVGATIAWTRRMSGMNQ